MHTDVKSYEEHRTVINCVQKHLLGYHVSHVFLTLEVVRGSEADSGSYDKTLININIFLIELGQTRP